MFSIDSLFSRYANLKHDLEGHGQHFPDTVIGMVYNGMSAACGVLTYELVPLLNRTTTGKVYSFVQAHFSKATAAFSLGVVYDPSWLPNLGLSALTMSLDQKFASNKMYLARDIATGLFLLHTIKAANNLVSFVSAPNVPDAVGCLFDAASAIYASQLIEANEYQTRIAKET